MNSDRQRRMQRADAARMLRDERMNTSRDNDWFFDQFDKTERRIEKIWKWAPVIWAIGFGLSAAVAITVIWAIIKIVSALT